MDPVITSSLIGVGGNLLGGLFGNRAARKAEARAEANRLKVRAENIEDTKQQFVRLREAADLGGFNPLAVLGMGSGVPAGTSPTPVSANNYMGEAIATSSLMLADSLAKTKAAASGRRVEDLNRQRDILTRKLANATLRPTVPGVFDRARNFGTGTPNANVNSVRSGVYPNVSAHADRIEPKERNVAELISSQGETTRVPVGPDIDEVVSGALIDWYNMAKANRNPYGYELPFPRQTKPQNSNIQGALIPNEPPQGRSRGTQEFDTELLSEFGEFPKKKRPVITYRAFLPPVFWNMAR